MEPIKISEGEYNFFNFIMSVKRKFKRTTPEADYLGMEILNQGSDESDG